MHLANGEPHVNGQSYHPHDRVQEAISRVQQAARAEKSGAAQDHVNLVEAVRQLNLAVETPQETLMRMRFQVRRSHQCCEQINLLRSLAKAAS